MHTHDRPRVLAADQACRPAPLLGREREVEVAPRRGHLYHLEEVQPAQRLPLLFLPWASVREPVIARPGVT